MKPLDKILSQADKSARHLITFSFNNGTIGSSSVFVNEDGTCDHEHPDFIEHINKIISAGDVVSIVLRTFDRSRMVTPPWNPDIKIPTKIVRGWLTTDTNIIPVSEKDMFAAQCTDAKTGELLPPEESVEYASGWTV